MDPAMDVECFPWVAFKVEDMTCFCQVPEHEDLFAISSTVRNFWKRCFSLLAKLDMYSCAVIMAACCCLELTTLKHTISWIAHCSSDSTCVNQVAEFLQEPRFKVFSLIGGDPKWYIETGDPYRHQRSGDFYGFMIRGGCYLRIM